MSKNRNGAASQSAAGTCSSRKHSGVSPSPASVFLLQLASVQAVLQITSYSADLVLEVAERMLHGSDLEDDGEGESDSADFSSSRRAKDNANGSERRSSVKNSRGPDNQRNVVGSSPAKTITAEALLMELEDRHGPGPADAFVGHRLGGQEASSFEPGLAVDDAAAFNPTGGAMSQDQSAVVDEDMRRRKRHVGEALAEATNIVSYGDGRRRVGEAASTSSSFASLRPSEHSPKRMNASPAAEAGVIPSNHDRPTAPNVAPNTAGSASASEGAPETAVGAGRDLNDPSESRRIKERVHSLKVENAKLKARQLCHQCKARPAGLTLLPCGHFLFCVQCGRAFDQCPVCHKTVLADVVTFVA